MTRHALSWTDRTEISALLKRMKAPTAQGIVADHKPEVIDDDKTVSPAKRQTFTRPDASLFERVEALCTWADKTFSPQSIFLADEHGLMVHGFRADARYVAVMSPLLAAMGEIGTMLDSAATRGAVTLKDGEVLQWVESTSANGRFSLGLLQSEVLPEKDLIELQQALAAVMTD